MLHRPAIVIMRGNPTSFSVCYDMVKTMIKEASESKQGLLTKNGRKCVRLAISIDEADQTLKTYDRKGAAEKILDRKVDTTQKKAAAPRKKAPVSKRRDITAAVPSFCGTSHRYATRARSRQAPQQNTLIDLLGPDPIVHQQQRQEELLDEEEGDGSIGEGAVYAAQFEQFAYNLQKLSEWFYMNIFISATSFAIFAQSSYKRLPLRIIRPDVSPNYIGFKETLADSHTKANIVQRYIVPERPNVEYPYKRFFQFTLDGKKVTYDEEYQRALEKYRETRFCVDKPGIHSMVNDIVCDRNRRSALVSTDYTRTMAAQERVAVDVVEYIQSKSATNHLNRTTLVTTWNYRAASIFVCTDDEDGK